MGLQGILPCLENVGQVRIYVFPRDRIWGMRNYFSKIACAGEEKERAPLLCPLGKEHRKQEQGSPEVPVEVEGSGGGAALPRKRPRAAVVP